MDGEILHQFEGFGNEQQKVIVFLVSLVVVGREAEMDGDGGQRGEKVAVECFDDQLEVGIGKGSGR